MYNSFRRIFKPYSPWIRKAGQFTAAYGAKKVLGGVGRAVARRWNNKKFGKAQGFYQGPFKKPTRKGVKLPKIDTKCLSIGYQKTGEIYGLVNDPDCVYIGHSTWNREYMAKAITGALIRKLFRKAGFDIPSATSPLIHPEVAASDVNYRIEFQTINPDTGSVGSYQCGVTTNTTTLEDVVNASSFMYAYIAGYLGLTNSADPYMLQLQMLDVKDVAPTPDVVYRPICQLPLQNETMHLFISSKLKVQNRTLGAATGSTADADRVDAQPLNGRLYSFKNADPRLSYLQNQTTDGSYYLNRISETGTTLLRSAQLATNYKNPPVPKVFANIDRSSFVSLEPGAIKQSNIHYKFTGKLVNALKLMRPTSSGEYPTGQTPPASGFSGIRGRMALIALQERLSTNSDNKITVSYERELNVGCYFVTKKNPVYLSTYGEDPQNNVT